MSESLVSGSTTHVHSPVFESGKVSPAELQVGPEIVDKIRGMTDRVLGAMGFPDGETTPVPVIEFTVTNPDLPGRELRIYSIADGVTGYNTGVNPLRPEDDNSRRWVIYNEVNPWSLEPGAPDIRTIPDIGNIGAVYESGGAYHPGEDISGYRPPITGTTIIENVIAEYYDNNPNGTVVANLHRGTGGKHGVEFGSVPLHRPLPEVS